MSLVSVTSTTSPELLKKKKKKKKVIDQLHLALISYQFEQNG